MNTPLIATIWLRAARGSHLKNGSRSERSEPGMAVRVGGDVLLEMPGSAERAGITGAFQGCGWEIFILEGGFRQLRRQELCYNGK